MQKVRQSSLFSKTGLRCPDLKEEILVSAEHEFGKIGFDDSMKVIIGVLGLLLYVSLVPASVTRFLTSSFTSTLKLQDRELVLSTIVTELGQPAFVTAACSNGNTTHTGTTCMLSLQLTFSIEPVLILNCETSGKTEDGSPLNPLCIPTGTTLVASEKNVRVHHRANRTLSPN